MLSTTPSPALFPRSVHRFWQGMRLLVLVIASLGLVRAQTFSLETESVALATFHSIQTTLDLRLQSSDPAFDPSQLSVSVSPPGWLAASIDPGTRSLRLSCGYGMGEESEGEVVVRSATHSATLAVGRIPVGRYRTPTALLSSDRARIFALYEDTVVLFDANTRGVLARAWLSPVPGNTFSATSARKLSLSDDETELRVHFADSSVLVRLSASDLALLGTVPLPPAGIAPTFRTFAGEKNGALYFLRHGGNLASPSGDGEFLDASVEVISTASGALIQSYRLPASANLSTIDSVELHPDRAELWAVERRNSGSWQSTTSLRRLSLGGDGSIAAPRGEPLFLETLIFWSYYPGPWAEDAPRLQLPRGGTQAIWRNRIIDDSGASPAVAGTITSYPIYFANNGISAGRFAFAIPGEEAVVHTYNLLPAYSSPEIIGFSEDGRDFVTVSHHVDLSTGPVPVAHFLPALLADQPAGKVRIPRDGAIVFPTSTLDWYPLPGADHYRVFISSRPEDLTPADPAAEFLLAEPHEAGLSLSAPLAAGAVYHWRVDAVFGDRVVVGDVQHFAVALAKVEQAAPEVATVVGARRRDFALPILTASADTAWQVVSDSPWLTVRNGAGPGPGSAELSIDALALGVGDTSAALRLVTANGSVPINLTVRVVAPDITSMAPVPGLARILACGPPVTINGVAERLLLSIDPASEQILRCTSIPATRFEIPTVPVFTATSATQPFYIISAIIGEFDLETLELNRAISPPWINDSPVQVRAVRQAPQGRVWILTSDHILARLNPATKTYELVLPAMDADTSYLSADGASLYTYTLEGDYYDWDSFTLRRHDLQDQTLKLVAERTVSFGDSRAPYGATDGPAHLLAPLRFMMLGVVYDELLQPIADLDDPEAGSMITAGAFSTRAMLYAGADLSEARVQSPNFGYYAVRCLDPVSRKLVVHDQGRFHFKHLDGMPLAVASSLKVDKSHDTYVTLAWDRAPDLGEWTSGYLTQTIAFRTAGSEEPWVIHQAGYASGFPFGLYSLNPETSYEVRIRISSYRGPISRWSETFAFTTGLPRPAANYSTLPGNQTLREGAVWFVAPSIDGRELTWQVSGLPPGLTFNPATRAIEGAPTTRGTYGVKITVTNSGGSFTHEFQITVGAAIPSFARYSGLQAYSLDPLAGDWRATRSVGIFTVHIRTFAGAGSFKVQPWPRSYYDQHVYYGSFVVTIGGVQIPGIFVWDTLDDRCRLSLSFHNYGSNSLAETGSGVSHDKTAPHPFAARYTGLGVENPDDPTGHVVPDGANLLRLDLGADGAVAVRWESALGKPFTTQTNISHEGLVPIFCFDQAQHFWGLLAVHRSAESSGPRFAGGVSWVKYPNAKAAAYRSGFIDNLLAFGAPLPATGKNLPPLYPLANTANRADFVLYGGGLSRISNPIVQSLAPTAAGLVAPKPGTPANPNRVTVKIDATTGIVTGSAAILDATGKKVRRTQGFRGTFVKNPLGDGEDIIGGFFLLPDAKGVLQSGAVEIFEPRPESEPAP